MVFYCREGVASRSVTRDRERDSQSFNDYGNPLAHADAHRA